jgi:hypothetical protein
LKLEQVASLFHLHFVAKRLKRLISVWERYERKFQATFRKGVEDYRL